MREEAREREGEGEGERVRETAGLLLTADQLVDSLRIVYNANVYALFGFPTIYGQRFFFEFFLLVVVIAVYSALGQPSKGHVCS